jgi:hypothetical protein
MRYLIVFVLGVAAAALCIHFVPQVPGATGADGRLSDAFWLNGFFMVLGFLVTTAAVSPAVAWWLHARDYRAWRAARLNVRERLGGALRQSLRAYGAFLGAVASGDPHGLAASHLSTVLRELGDFFDTYDSEHSALDAPMHSAASNLRRHLLPFRRALQTTQETIGRLRSHRIYVGHGTLNELRAVFDKLPLNAASLAVSRPFFQSDAQLFFDLRLDQRLGPGWLPVHRFVALDAAHIRREWQRFEAAFKRADRGGALPAAALQLAEDSDTQARLHARYVDTHVDEPWVAATLVHDSLGR